MKDKIIIATIKSWNIENAMGLKKEMPDYDFELISEPADLTLEKVKQINPVFIFFPHWSWIIPSEIYKRFRCVVFHITDLPYGRGGSPLQNLILNKVYNTKISAITVGKDIDTGDIYLKKELDISHGSAGEILKRASGIIFFEMIPLILSSNIEPLAQSGKVVNFRRRKPEESNIENASLVTLNDYYDFIRMMDGEGYPRAYLNINNIRFEFEQVSNKNGELTGKFIITDNEE